VNRAGPAYLSPAAAWAKVWLRAHRAKKASNINSCWRTPSPRFFWLSASCLYGCPHRALLAAPTFLPRAGLCPPPSTRLSEFKPTARRAETGPVPRRDIAATDGPSTQKPDELAAVHSITSSARASSSSGTVRPSILAVRWLMTSTSLVGACTGRSAGFSSLRMRST
jgi:hypothetical protein